jgi:hypothetical protein
MSFVVKYWETEEDREQGFSDEYDVFEDEIEAIECADDLYNHTDYVCVEVQDIDNCFETVHHRSVD